MKRRIAITAALACWFIAGAGRAALGDWTPPSDNLLTEQQLHVYLATANDWLDENAKIADALSQAQTPVQKGAVLSDLDQRHRACLARHHITEAEYNWIARRATAAWDLAAFLHDSYITSQADFRARADEIVSRMRQAQTRAARYALALKEDRQVMSTEDRTAAIETARSEQQSAVAQAEQSNEEAQTAALQADQDDADAKAAQNLADDPPDDVSPVDRADYVSQKRQEAQDARAAAKEARNQEADAQAAQADALAEADDAGQIALQPDIPITYDDKAAVKAENQAALAQANAELAQCQIDLQQIAAFQSTLKKSLDDRTRQVPAQNLELMKKHFDDFKNLFAPSGGT
jgi:hypothetical protein